MKEYENAIDEVFARTAAEVKRARAKTSRTINFSHLFANEWTDIGELLPSDKEELMLRFNSRGWKTENGDDGILLRFAPAEAAVGPAS
ncbi:MAG: hypothetical protein M3R59_08860 [Verrucomicrobiota bacterium]|nr:hypothetical protein [Verrucomicrobiota bacterium]